MRRGNWLGESEELSVMMVPVRGWRARGLASTPSSSSDVHRDIEPREGIFKRTNFEASLGKVEAPRVTHRGCGLSLAVALISEAARLFRKQFALMRYPDCHAVTGVGTGAGVSC